MRIFVTADLPAYECADPALERQWSEAVGEGDLVYVIAGEAGHWILPHLEALSGHKRLVTGATSLPGGYVLSPLPLHPGQLGPGEINLHGRPLRLLPADPRRRCVSLAACGFRPVALDAMPQPARPAPARPRLRLVAPAEERGGAAEALTQPAC